MVEWEINLVNETQKNPEESYRRSIGLRSFCHGCTTDEYSSTYDDAYDAEVI